MSKIDYSNVHLSTKLIHAGQGADPETGALSTPIYQTSTFCFESIEHAIAVGNGTKAGYMYSRAMNPTTKTLEEKLAMMEGGETAICTSSGMGAIGSLLIGLLNTGDHIVCGNTIYGGTDYVMRENMPALEIEVTFVDTTNLAEIESAIKENTKLIYFETPTNPTMAITDIEAVGKIGKKYGIKVAVDNTFAPPPIQYPLKLGADIVVHSVTKYINGHGDVIGGVVIGKAEDIAAVKARGVTKLCGTPQSPFNSYLVLRGMKTMYLRVKQHCENAMKVAEYLEKHPYVKKVFYPGLKSHPQHDIVMKQMQGLYTGILSFELKEGINGLSSFEAGKKLLNSLTIPAIAVSLGDPDTLIEHPASMTHDNVPKEAREAIGITDGLIRLSVGLEFAEDLIVDFENAFKKI